MKKTTTLLFLIFCIYNISYGTHNKAGEIIFSQLDNQLIKCSVYTYSKLSSTPADRDSLTICWGDGICERIERVNGPIGSSGSPQGEVISDDTKLNIYTWTHAYENPGSYIISMSDPNRNGGILNVNFPNSEQVQFYIEAELNLLADGTLNSSPVLLEPPIDVAFLQVPYMHVLNAFDADGDSIAFELITPLMDNANSVPSYILPSEIEPGPNNQFFLDEETGVIIWDAPQKTGEYNIAILVKSYRNGEIIDKITRDMQILVEEGSVIPPEIMLDLPEDVVMEVEIGDTVYFEFTASATEASQNLSLSSTSGLYDFFETPAEFQATVDNNSGSGSFKWIVDEEHLRDQPYQVVIKAKNDFMDIGSAWFKVLRYRVVSQFSSTEDPSKNQNKISIYPNPSNGPIHVFMEKYQQPLNFNIVNANGKVIQSGQITGKQQEINLSNLPKSVYYLKINEPFNQQIIPILLNK